MKQILSFIILIISFQFVFASNYEVGDTLNVFAINGLNLRSNQNLKSEVIKIIGFGEKVIIKSEAIKSDTIDFRFGNWIKVSTLDQTTGYIFDPFISNFPIPTDYQIKESQFEEYILSNFEKTSCEIIFEPPSIAYRGLTEKSIFNCQNGITFIITSGYEYVDTEIIFANIRFGELITLAELFYSQHKFSRKDFKSELSNSFKKSPNKLRIDILGPDLFIILENGKNSKSIFISFSTG